MDVKSTQQTRSTHWEEPYNYQTLNFFGKLTSLRQNIISAIKVMKGMVFTKDDEY